jgi:hypothetical protein
LNVFRGIRLLQTCVSEAVAAISTNIPLNVAVFGVPDAVFPVSFASTFRADNGRECFQFLFALPFHKIDF